VILAVFKFSISNFSIVLLVIILAGAWEWSSLAGFENKRDRFIYSMMVLVLIFTLWPLVYVHSIIINKLLVTTVVFWLLALLWILCYASKPTNRNRALIIAAAGLFVLVTTWASLVVLRTEFGLGYVLFLLLLVWSADTGAFFAGQRWGRHKMAKTISPGKTWEGATGGAVVTLMLAFTGEEALGWTGPRIWFVMLCMITMAFSILGDLFESMIKRQIGYKDSSALLPGHGGILDRLDSLTAAAPVFLIGLYGICG
jgi:phosphatidate cytidylyltransferase